MIPVSSFACSTSASIWRTGRVTGSAKRPRKRPASCAAARFATTSSLAASSTTVWISASIRVAPLRCSAARTRTGRGTRRCSHNSSTLHAARELTSEDATALHTARDGLRRTSHIASAETIGKDQMAGSDHPDHQLVTRYVQNRDSADWAILVGKIIMAQPFPPLGAVEGAKVRVATLGQNPF
jgi:hypothetical protein